MHWSPRVFPSTLNPPPQPLSSDFNAVRNNTDRLFERIEEEFAGERIVDGFAMAGDHHAGIVAPHAQDVPAVPDGTTDRGAHVHGVEETELVEMLFHQIRELE